MTRSAARDLASVTMIGPSLTRADSYATAAFAMGPKAVSWTETIQGYEALVVHPDGRVRCTSRFPHPPAASQSIRERFLGFRANSEKSWS